MTLTATTPRSADGTPLTAAQQLKLGRASFKRTDDGTEKMNVNGTPAGSATNIWDGTGAGDTGSGDWTPSGTGSETAGSMHAGTNGWDTGSAAKDSDTLFTNSSDIDVSGYAQLSFWMQPKVFPSGSKVELQWKTVAGSNVGNKVDLASYVSDFDLDVWQKVTIPMSDFSIGSNVGRLQVKYAKEAGQQFWFDEFAFTSAGGGGPYIFRLAAPDADTRYHLSMLVALISAPSSGWNPTTFGSISALANGFLVRHRRLSDSEVLWFVNSKDNVALFGQYHPQDDVTFATGDLLVGFMIKPGKASVIVTNDEVVEFVVRDDLSSMGEMRAYAHYGVEVIP